MREFVDKQKMIAQYGNILDCEIEHPSYESTVREIIDGADASTETEIIRPYLEKIREEIAGLDRFELRGTVTPLVNVDRAIEIIDGILPKEFNVPIKIDSEKAPAVNTILKGNTAEEIIDAIAKEIVNLYEEEDHGDYFIEINNFGKNKDIFLIMDSDCQLFANRKRIPIDDGDYSLWSYDGGSDDKNRLFEWCKKELTRVWNEENLHLKHPGRISSAELAKVFGTTLTDSIKYAIYYDKTEITEVYDNAVDITIHTDRGDVTLGAYCYYKDEDVEKEHPLIGTIDYDGDKGYVEFSEKAFLPFEKKHFQKLLDEYPFEKGQFLTKEEMESDR